MEKKVFFSGLVLVLIIAIGVPVVMDKSDRSEIRNWAALRNENVVDIERILASNFVFLGSGKHHRVYEVKTDKGHYYIRKGNVFGGDDIKNYE